VVRAKPWRAGCRALLLAAGLLLARPRAGETHPLHTTITELSEDRPRGTVRAVIRVFADDFRTSMLRAGGRVAPPSADPAWSAAVAGHAQRGFALSAAGRPIMLRGCGVKRAGELLWICLEGTAASGLAGISARNGLLTELFPDQVNIVQATVGGARRSMLFTARDGIKLLR
jgi:hypothetical protein